MKIVFFETNAIDQRFLTHLLKAVGEPVFIPEALTEETVDQAADADVISVMVESQVTDKVIDKLKSANTSLPSQYAQNKIIQAFWITTNEKNRKLTNNPSHERNKVQ